jgi:ATP-dependent helicase/nuclease subunit B
LDYIRERTATLSASKIESFLQCPYRYFAGNLLRLREAPPRPELRLNKNYLRMGEIVHATLARWWGERGDIATVFETVFAETAAKEHIITSYQTERARNTMLDDLRKFVSSDEWDRSLYVESRIEEPFAFPLNDSLTVSGKIDRLEVTPDGRAVVIDYKYSNAQNTKAKLENEDLLQPPLYLMAAERAFGLRPDTMYYIGLKAGVEYVQWEAAEGWRERATEKTLRVVGEMRGGRIAVAPSDPDKCRFCDAKDVCRVEVGAAAALEAGA